MIPIKYYGIAKKAYGIWEIYSGISIIAILILIPYMANHESFTVNNKDIVFQELPGYSALMMLKPFYLHLIIPLGLTSVYSFYRGIVLLTMKFS